MKQTPREVFIVRLRDPSGSTLARILHLCNLPELSPYWRRHAPNLLTLRVAEPSCSLAADLATTEGVDHVVPLRGAPLYARWPGGQPTPLSLGGAAFGGDEPIVIAGPCSVEGRAQIRDTAQAVAAAGAKGLRGGVFKPRTSPYGFGGLGTEGLRMMVEAGKEAGLPTCTEVLEPACLDVVAEQADVMQIGSRNMHNMPFLFALGADPRGRPALLKRGFGATVAELLDAAEYFLLGRIAAGHKDPGLILCERGVRTFETTTRFTLDVGAISVMRSRTHLPVVVDPSHPAGDHRLVTSLAAAGIAAGADGLLVEVHPDPENAWCDGPQSLSFREFEEMMVRVSKLRSGDGAEAAELAAFE